MLSPALRSSLAARPQRPRAEPTSAQAPTTACSHGQRYSHWPPSLPWWASSSVTSPPSGSLAHSHPLAHVPEDTPSHREAELPAVADLGGHITMTLLIVGILAYARRQKRTPRGGSPAALTQMSYVVPALLSVAGAAVIDMSGRQRDLATVIL